MSTLPVACPNCQTPIPEGGRYCTGCGLDVSDPSGQTTVSLGSPEDEELKRLVQEATSGIYRIDREIGRGGMAAVFLATEVELRRKVAIKVLPPEFTFGPGMIERFQREARTAAQLDHPNIIPIYRVGTAGRLLYFAMKYVEGRSVADILHERDALPIPTTTAVLEAVASALAYAHERGVVHRDIKPANILIDRQGVVLVSDFGIARASHEATLTESGAVVGTPQYMSPEQCSGQRVTAASDQYSLGVVGYHMLAGRVPFDAESAIALLQQHILEQPPPLQPLRPDAPPELVQLIERAMQKDPGERFPTMTEFAEAVELIRIAEQHAPEGRAQLKALAVGDTISGLKVVTPASGPSRIKKRRSSRSLVGTLAALGIAGAGAIGIWQWRAPRTAELQPVAPDTIASTETASRELPAGGDTRPASTQEQTETAEGASEQDTATIGAPPAQTPAPARPTPVTLTFAGLPTGAFVTANGNPVRGGRASLPPGSYTIEIRADGFEPFSQTITLEAGQSRSFAPALVPIPRQPGTLSVGSLPSGTLYVDDQRVGPLPVRNLTIAAGERRIRIEAAGHAPYDTLVVVQPGQAINLRMIRLKPEGG